MPFESPFSYHRKNPPSWQYLHTPLSGVLFSSSPTCKSLPSRWTAPLFLHCSPNSVSRLPVPWSPHGAEPVGQQVTLPFVNLSRNEHGAGTSMCSVHVDWVSEILWKCFWNNSERISNFFKCKSLAVSPKVTLLTGLLHPHTAGQRHDRNRVRGQGWCVRETDVQCLLSL